MSSKLGLTTIWPAPRHSYKLTTNDPCPAANLVERMDCRMGTNASKDDTMRRHASNNNGSRPKLTLSHLPYEIVLSIVKWTAEITLEDQLEAERREHERTHHHGHDHGPHAPGGLGGEDDADLGGNGGANGFMDFAGLMPPGAFGAFGGGMGGGPAGPGGGQNANGAGEDGDQTPPLPPFLNGFMDAVMGGPFGMHTGPATGTAAADEDTDEEMPALEALPGSAEAAPPLAASSAPASVPGPAHNDDDDDEMPPLQDISYGSGPAASAPEPLSSAASVTVTDDSDNDEVATAVGSPTDAYPVGNLNVEIPEVGQEGTAIFSPAAPSTASITGSLAHELETQQNAAIYSTEDVEDMPDLDEPGSSQEDGGSEWSTEDENGGGEEDSEQDDEEDEDHDIDAHVDAALAEVEADAIAAEGREKEQAKEPVTYEDGLPACPYLALALINRSFLNACRTMLYGRHVHLVDPYQAHLLLRTLTSPQVSVNHDEPDADDEDMRQQQSLGYMVRDFSFDVRALISLGRGGASLLLDLIKQCPRLERFAYSSDLMKSAQKPLEAALAKCTNMRAVALRGGDVATKDLVWTMRNLAPLMLKWPQLKDLQVLWLKHSLNGAVIPAPKVHLTKLSLAYCDIGDSHLLYLLKHSHEHLRQLDLHRPTTRLTRAGIAKVIITHGAGLESLQLDVPRTWHSMTSLAPAAEAAAISEERASRSRYLIDGLIGYMPKLMELKLSGSLASTILFARLPKEISVIALEDNMGVDVRKLVALLKRKRTLKGTKGKGTKSVPVVAPKLRCFTVSRSDGAMLSEQIMSDLDKILDARKACIHWSYSDPTSVWRPDGTGPPAGAAAALGMMGGFLGMGMGMGMGPGGPFPPDFAGMGGPFDPEGDFPPFPGF